MVQAEAVLVLGGEGAAVARVGAGLTEVCGCGCGCGCGCVCVDRGMHFSKVLRVCVSVCLCVCVCVSVCVFVMALLSKCTRALTFES